MRALWVTALLAACARQGASWTPAFPSGAYTAERPHCVSTDQPPDYPAPSFRLALFDFDGLTTHTLTLDLQNATEVFADGACRITAVHGIFRNYDGVYSTMHGRRFTFEPAGCGQTVTAGGATFPATPATTDLLKDSNERTEEILFDVSPEADGRIQLESHETPDLDDVWSAYGCAKPDRLRQTFRSTRP